MTGLTKKSIMLLLTKAPLLLLELSCWLLLSAGLSPVSSSSIWRLGGGVCSSLGTPLPTEVGVGGVVPIRGCSCDCPPLSLEGGSCHVGCRDVVPPCWSVCGEVS